MDGHPIESIMTTTMESIREMVDVNTVIGDPVQTGDGSTIIPLSRVSFGFVAGGGEYEDGKRKEHQDKQVGEVLPFAGGSGAGVSVQPMGFLVVNGDQVKMLPAQYYAPVDRIIELVPQMVHEVKKMFGKGEQDTM
jgi:sporulation protein YtfJ